MGPWNARSAVSKALDVNDLVVESDRDVLCLSEAWLMEARDDLSICDRRLLHDTLFFTDHACRVGVALADSISR